MILCNPIYIVCLYICNICILIYVYLNTESHVSTTLIWVVGFASVVEFFVPVILNPLEDDCQSF